MHLRNDVRTIIYINIYIDSVGNSTDKQLIEGGTKFVFMKKRGGRSPVYMCISTYTLGGAGGMLPQEILVFRLSDVVETGIERLIVAISKGGRFDPGGECPPPLNEPQTIYLI